MKTVPLVSFNELEPAEELQRLLRQNAIHSVIRDESKLERFWFMSEPFAAIHVEVIPPDFLLARRLVEEWNVNQPVLNSAVHCPECNSTRVEFPQTTRKFITPTLISLLMVMRLVPRQFYCLDCQHTWPTVSPLNPKPDILGWPFESKMWHPETGARHVDAGSGTNLRH